MWDDQFCRNDMEIAGFWRKLELDPSEETVTAIYNAMHENLGRVWLETHRVLVNGGIACINIGVASRTVNGKSSSFPTTPE
jgi:hypothetical protein